MYMHTQTSLFFFRGARGVICPPPVSGFASFEMHHDQNSLRTRLVPPKSIFKKVPTFFFLATHPPTHPESISKTEHEETKQESKLESKPVIIHRQLDSLTHSLTSSA